ncbi:MAG: methyltransferase domain-containing protein [Rubrivivax sp.]|nr:methyltransferase domain-containing protein [Rubrivivax sp.]
MVRIIKATTRAHEYELRAKHLKDDYQLAGDGPRSTAFRIDKVLRLVDFQPGDRVLDISAGKGLLFDRIHARVRECVGTDVSPALVERVASRFADRPNVRFVCAMACKLPFEDASFDKITMTGAFLLQETVEECLQSLAEIRRVAKPGATIFISDIAIVEEWSLVPPPLSTWGRLRRRFQQDGIVQLPSSLLRYGLQRLRVMLEIEPIIIPSEHSLVFPDVVFVEMCRKNGLQARGFPTEEVTGTSLSRWDYLIKPV